MVYMVWTYFILTPLVAIWGYLMGYEEECAPYSKNDDARKRRASSARLGSDSFMEDFGPLNENGVLLMKGEREMTEAEMDGALRVRNPLAALRIQEKCNHCMNNISSRCRHTLTPLHFFFCATRILGEERQVGDHRGDPPIQSGDRERANGGTAGGAEPVLLLVALPAPLRQGARPPRRPARGL